MFLLDSGYKVASFLFSINSFNMAKKAGFLISSWTRPSSLKVLYSIHLFYKKTLKTASFYEYISMKLEDCYGRLFTQDQLEDDLLEQAQQLPAIVQEKTALICNRCGTQIDKARWKLQIGSYYCRTCIQLGRVRVTKHSTTFPNKPFRKKKS